MARLRAQPLRIVVGLRRSRAAIWARNMGALAVPVLVIGGLGSRAGLVPQAAMLPVLLTGFILGAAAFGAAVYALADIWTRGADGLGAALGGLAYSAPVMVLLAVVAAAAIAYPRLSDISTDLTDPPHYSGVAAAHGTPDAAARARQREAYEDVAPHLYAQPLEEVHRAAVALTRARGWTITHDTGAGIDPARPVPPAPEAEDSELSRALAEKRVLTQSRSEGVAAGEGGGATVADDEDAEEEPAIPPPARVTTIQAVAVTPLFAFRDDVVLRLAATAEGTRVDMRSASQIGEHDLGQNARRIRRFFNDLDRAVYGQAGPPGGSSLIGQAGNAGGRSSLRKGLAALQHLAAARRRLYRGATCIREASRTHVGCHRSWAAGRPICAR